MFLSFSNIEVLEDQITANENTRAQLMPCVPVITFPLYLASVISQARGLETSHFSRPGRANVSPRDWILLQILATEVAVGSRAAQTDTSWLSDKAFAIRLLFGLTTQTFTAQTCCPCAESLPRADTQLSKATVVELSLLGWQALLPKSRKKPVVAEQNQVKGLQNFVWITA